MVMLLHGEQGSELEVSHYSWRRALRVASRYGWEDGAEDWFARRGRRVSATEAALLADALESALPDVPRHDAMEDLRCEFGRLPDVVWFSGPRRELLKDLVRLCRTGGFRIMSSFAP